MKNPNYVLEVFGELCVEFFVRFRGVYLHTYTKSYQDQDSCQELDDLFSCCLKNLKKIWNLWVEFQSHKQENLWLLQIKEKSSSWIRNSHMVVVVSYNLRIVNYFVGFGNYALTTQ